MINLYGLNDIDYTKNGTAVLQPTSCLVSEQAGGSYELNMQHPMDARGTYALMQIEDIIKVPVPVATIESAVAGEDVDIYRVKTTGAAIRAKPNAPQRITYTAWVAVGGWEVGDKVTYSGDQKNYECTQYQSESSGRIPPPQNPGGWKEIASYTSGSPALVNPPVGEELYLISEYNAYWLYVQTHGGVQGYIQRSYAEYVRTETVEEVPERTVSEQLLRIYSIDENTAKNTLSVRARHVSYDLSGNLVKDCAVTAVEPAVALARMKDALLFDTENTIATNLTDEDGEFTGDFSWKNPINALLDPDSGLVNYFKAKLLRDNWDIFLYRNTAADRGVVLRYGSNLRGIRWKRSNDKNFYNRIMPVAQKANGDPLFLPDVWVDSPIMDTYRVVHTEYLKVDGKVGGDDGQGGTWTEAALLEHMQEVAERRFSVDNVDKISVELDVDFTLVGDTEEYRQYKGLQKLFLYDNVKVRDPFHGIEYQLQVASYEWDAINLRYTKMKLASVFDYGGRNVSGYNIVDGAIRPAKLSPDTITMLKEAIS